MLISHQSHVNFGNSSSPKIIFH